MFKQKAIKIFAVALAVMVALCAPLTASAATSNDYEFSFFVSGRNPYFNLDGTNAYAAGVFKYNNSNFYFWNWLPSKPVTMKMNYILMQDIEIPANSNYKFVFDNDLYMYCNNSALEFSNFSVLFQFSCDNSEDNFSIETKPQVTQIENGYKLEFYYETFLNKACKLTGFCFLSVWNSTPTTDFKFGYYSLGNEKIKVYCGPDTALQDYEKNQAESSGNDSIDGVVSALPSVDFSGLQNSLEILTQNMMYNGTDCVWTFPALKIPAIENVCPEIKLTGEQPIDIGAWVKKIPSAVLMVLQACCSIGIILFIIYELYSFIIFCMTLKSNQVGKDEESEN